LRYGVTVAGPMDPFALATANLALGRPRDAAVIEVSLSGLEVEAVGCGLTLAICGGAFDIRLGATRLPSAVVLRLEPGTRLSIRASEIGAWAYIAVAGRIDLPAVLGSLSTHTRSGMGGLSGRGLVAGDVVPVVEADDSAIGLMAIRAPWLEHNAAPIRVVLGPQDDCFSPEQIQTFLTQGWTLSSRSDRMAYGLTGAPLVHAKGHDIVSDGIAHGAIQIPGSGLPYVLMADRQPTGGYPKIATIISADLGRMAQLQAGAIVHFEVVPVADAVAVRRRIEDGLTAKIALIPLIRTAFPSELLLGLNLISGVIDGQEPG
jgi:biotin-dependent carboxylase-like uncharacterized protein